MESNIELIKRACLMADNSTCGYKVGCVIVKDGDVIVESYNQTLPGNPYCLDGTCVRESQQLSGGVEPDKVCSIHAEASAIAECAKKGISLNGSSLYISTYPCIICSRLIAKSGIKKLFYMSDYPQKDFYQKILENAQVEQFQILESEVWKN